MNERINIDYVMVVIPEPGDVGWKLEEYLDVAPHSEHVDDFLLKYRKRWHKFEVIMLQNTNTE